MKDLVTILTSQLPNGLSIAKTYLEDNDISCIIKDELMNQMYSAIGASELQVRNDQVEDAIRLLIEGGFAKLEDYQPDSTLVEVTKALEKLTAFFGGKKEN